MEANAILPLDHFEKDFEIISKISEGKYGQVFKAKKKSSKTLRLLWHSDIGDGEMLAVKFLSCDKASDKLKVRREIDILKQFNHKNILRLYGAYEDSDNFIEVFELLSGGELFERFMDKEDWPSENEVKGYIRQICVGCSYLAEHSVVHLDLKPENIMFERKSSDLLKIVDFGFARQLSPGTDVFVSEGTPEFVSPEIINVCPVSVKTDLWSIGVLTYILLSGLSPFLGSTIQETYDNIKICNFTLEEEPFNRVSYFSKDFIAKLLVIDQDLRMCASQALEHPWLKILGIYSNDRETTSQRPHFKDTFRRLSKVKHQH